MLWRRENDFGLELGRKCWSINNYLVCKTVYLYYSYRFEFYPTVDFSNYYK